MPTHNLRTILWALVALLAGCVAGASPSSDKTVADEAGYVFGACAEDAVGRYGTGPIRSLHVPVRDGVRIALDVVLPEGLAEGEKVPTVLHMTRFWRATEEAGPHPVQQFYTRQGYAVVAGDVRGTGASFGVWQLQQVTFKEDAPQGWGGWSMDDWGIHAWKDAVEAAGTPIYSWGSWMDAGTANGVLRRFMILSNPQRVKVGPWSHGAVEAASPYRPAETPVDPPADRQRLEELCWLEQWVHGEDAGMADRLLVYYTMGEERWKTATEWPLSGTVHQDWFFRADGLLAPDAPIDRDGADSYEVHFEATTGTRNRWATQTTGGDVVYGDRAAADERLLVYDSEPLPADLEITGQPVVTLHVTSTHDDGAFFVYLEDVAPDGTVRYLTEGMLRAVHRRVSDEPPPYRTLGPYHSFRRVDAMPLVPGEAVELTFEMMPTSVLIRAGHRIRIAVAGADADTFQRVPETGRPVIRVHRSTALPSHVMLPVVPRP